MEGETLFRNLRAREPQAQQELIRVFSPRLFLYFRNRIKGESHYEDLVQDVFSAFFNGLDQGKLASAEWIAPFMFGIAKRVMFSYFYKQKKSNEIRKNAIAACEPGSEPGECERLESQTLREALRGLIGALPRIDRLILNSFYLQEKKIAEIAEETGRSHHYISVRKERALKKIRSEIIRRNLY